jgi:hypothetical protein
LKLQIFLSKGLTVAIAKWLVNTILSLLLLFVILELVSLIARRIACELYNTFLWFCQTLVKTYCFLLQKIGLQLKANLENVTNLTPTGDDFRWYIKVRCHYMENIETMLNVINGALKGVKFLRFVDFILAEVCQLWRGNRRFRLYNFSGMNP